MIPFDYLRLAQIIHQERIQAAEAPRPEWAYVEYATPRSTPIWARLRAWLLARAPRRRASPLAAPPRLDPASR